MTERNTPWEEDEIRFLPGNWTIERGEYIGKYRYEVDGIRAQGEVDAVQLLEWGMAALIDYEALKPWSGSGIAFTTDQTILRDLADTTGAERDRWYYLCEDGKLVRANKFYLVQKGYAAGDETVARQVRAAKLKGKKELQTIPWESDDIVLVAREGWKITRAANEGRYRVVHDGLTLNWNAARLIEEGAAKPAYDLKLNKLSDKESATMAKLCASTHGFWMAEGTPDMPEELRDVAKLWQTMCDKPLCAAVMRIDAHHRAIADRFGNRVRQESEAQATLDKADEYRKTAQAALDEATRLGLQCATYRSLNIDRSDGDFDVLYLRHQGKVTEAEEGYKAGFAALDAFGADTESTPESATLFPIEILPPLAKQQLQPGYAAAKTGLTAPSPLASMRGAFDAISEGLEKVRTALYPVKQRASEAYDAVEERRARRRELNELKKRIPDKVLRARPPLFARPHKEDRIKYTTGAKIKKEGSLYSLTLYGIYGSITAGELVYMGLAKRI